MNKRRPHRLNTDPQPSQTLQETSSHQRSSARYCLLPVFILTVFRLLFEIICMLLPAERANVSDLGLLPPQPLSPAAQPRVEYFHGVLHLINCSDGFHCSLDCGNTLNLSKKTFLCCLCQAVFHYINRTVTQKFP